jgi:hypothetical protein
MSIDFHKVQHHLASSNNFNIKTDTELKSQREVFRSTQSENSYLQIITEIYEIIRSIRDAEHPYTLEQLDVINEKEIQVEEKNGKLYVTIFWKPVNAGQYTAHVGMAILMKLQEKLKGMNKLKITLTMKGGSPKYRKMIDKQLNDKERLAAARENENLLSFIEGLIS